MAVVVPEGVHTVNFIYQEPGLSAGIALSLLGLILLCGYLAAVSRQKLSHIY